MCDLPLDVDPQEVIVRCIMCPSHVKAGKTSLKPAAFRSKGGTDEVSVIRHDHMGVDFCKEKAQAISKLSGGVNTYAGLAAIRAQAIRDVGSEIHDSREEFCGHAHISHGMVLPVGEPAESEAFIAITERCRALVAQTRYHPDPNATAAGWQGAQPLL